MARALRNVQCFACGLRKPERTSVQAQTGRNGAVNVWLCKTCAADPEKGAKKRQKVPR